MTEGQEAIMLAGTVGVGAVVLLVVPLLLVTLVILTQIIQILRKVESAAQQSQTEGQEAMAEMTILRTRMGRFLDKTAAIRGEEEAEQGGRQIPEETEEDHRLQCGGTEER
jgi:predicted Holliday junction resolvase-like endonuclease